MKEVIVIGGANIDIKAKAGRELIAGTSNPGTVDFALGGVARNIAHNLARLDMPVALLSAVGTDAFGNNVLAQTEIARVDCSMVLRVREPTGSYVAILDHQGEMTVAVNAMSAMDRITPEAIAVHERRLKSAQLILADCNLPRESLAWLGRFAGKLIVEPVSVAKSDKVSALAGQTVFAITLNRSQAEHICGSGIDGVGDALSAAAHLHDRGFERVVVTLGSGGAVASHVGRGSAHVKALSETTRDVTGAGDAAAAGLIFGLMNGFDLVKAVHYGQAAAALTVVAVESVSSDLTRARLLSYAASRMDGG